MCVDVYLPNYPHFGIRRVAVGFSGSRLMVNDHNVVMYKENSVDLYEITAKSSSAIKRLTNQNGFTLISKSHNNGKVEFVFTRALKKVNPKDLELKINTKTTIIYAMGDSWPNIHTTGQYGYGEV